MRNANQRNAKLHNPFRYGTVVDDPYFINRVKELAEVRQSLLSGQNLIIYSPRRYGKTSLIKKVLYQLESEGNKCIYIDFFRIHSREKFIEEYAKAVFRNFPSWEKALKKVISLVKTIRPIVAVNDQGLPELGINFSREQLHQAIDEVVNLPEKLSEGNRWIIVLDEFQEIERLNGENFEKELRASIQFHKNMSYVFLGSRRHLLTNMFTRKNRAFYNFGRLYKLDKIPEDEILSYLNRGFEKPDMKVDPVVLREIVTLTGNIPFYVQMLASIIWDLSHSRNEDISEALLKEGIKTMLWHQTDYYVVIMQELTAYQQKVLQALAHENTGIFTQAYTDRYYLSAHSSTQRALDTLMEKDLISKQENSYYFEDPFLKIWLLQNDE